jgi:PKHD-type hydroxylase
MLTAIPDVLDAEQLGRARAQLAASEWVDGGETAGHQSALVKRNQQLPEGSAVARELGDMIIAALERNALFVSAALPHRVFPPLFNRYQGGQNFGAHVDNAIRSIRGTAQRVRTDLSATLFLSDPGEYDGGELIIDDRYGVQSVKLPAGHLLLYPASSLHRVQPVTRGVRVASFFWVQSLVRDDGARALLFDMDNGIRQLRTDVPQHAAILQLTGVYHNLLRRWAET